jgi:hypothetical protein
VSEDRLAAIEGRLRLIETQLAVEAKAGEGIDRRLDKIEDTLTWLVRLILGAIILAFIGFAVTNGLGNIR